MRRRPFGAPRTDATREGPALPMMHGRVADTRNHNTKKHNVDDGGGDPADGLKNNGGMGSLGTHVDATSGRLDGNFA